MVQVFQLPADVIGVCKHAGDTVSIITKSSRKVQVLLWRHASKV